MIILPKHNQQEDGVKVNANTEVELKALRIEPNLGISLEISIDKNLLQPSLKQQLEIDQSLLRKRKDVNSILLEAVCPL